MKYFYKGTIDEFLIEVKIIQAHKNLREIIRITQINNRLRCAGFWVDESELIIK